MNRTIYLGIFLVLSMYYTVTASVNPVGEWNFHPVYILERNAAIIPANVIMPPVSNPPDYDYYPLRYFRGMAPGDRITGFFDADKFPYDEFSIEMWLLNHVNNDVALSFGIFGGLHERRPEFAFTYYTTGAELNIGDKQLKLFAIKRESGWKKYFHHIVIVYKADKINVYIEGALKSETDAQKLKFTRENAYMELSGFFPNEPCMKISSLLKNIRIYGCALTKREINDSFGEFKSYAECGIKYPGLFHFIAGPSLSNLSKDGVTVTVEASAGSKAVVSYGTVLPTGKEIESGIETGIHKIRLEKLEPGTKYFYEVKCTSGKGETISSGVSTFSTAPADGSGAMKFAIIGDTESRPHINDRVCKQVWDNRPDFAIQLGDLTDGGKQPNKFEWNYEFFTGMNQLLGRIPMMPVAGNGDGDLYWFNRYFDYGDTNGFYSFEYGNAEFFMLFSVRKEELAPGGRQYEWLEKKLAASKARWKFVALHYAPYSSDEDDYGNTWKQGSELGDTKVRKIVPLFEKYNVDMVFFGHLHSYERTWKIKDGKVSSGSGVVYIQNGGAGGNPEDFSPVRSWFSARTYTGFHYCIADINGPALELKTYNLDGALIDYLKLEK